MASVWGNSWKWWLDTFNLSHLQLGRMGPIADDSVDTLYILLKSTHIDFTSGEYYWVVKFIDVCVAYLERLWT